MNIFSLEPSHDPWWVGFMIAGFIILFAGFGLWLFRRALTLPLDSDASGSDGENLYNQAYNKQQEFMNIDGAEAWALDDVELRIHQLKRQLQNPASEGLLAGLVVVAPHIRNQIEDTLFKLERIAARKRNDDTSSGTIIGYIRE